MRNFVARSILLVALFCAGSAGAQQVLQLKSTGVAEGEVEAVLSAGAALHVRASNLGALLNTLDGLAMSFVPEKAVPPELQPLLQRPQPLLAFIGMNTFGQPLTPGLLGGMFGVALDQPVTLTVYFQPAGQAADLILSLPMKEPQALSAALLGISRARTFEQIKLGAHDAFHLVSTNSSLPPELFMLCSSNRVYISPNARIVDYIFGRGGPRLRERGVIAKALKEYSQTDLVAIFDTLPFQPLVTMVKNSFGVLPPMLFMNLRQEALFMPPLAKARLNTKLRLRLGIRDVEQALDYGEALAAGAYETIFAWCTEQLQGLEGAALSVSAGTTQQRLSVACFSSNLKAAASVQPVPLEQIKPVLAALPGTPTWISAQGRQPVEGKSVLLRRLIQSIKTKYELKGLPQERINAFALWLDSENVTQPLESQVPWVVRTSVGVPDTQNAKPETLLELLENLMTGSSMQLTVMPGQDETILEKHFAAKAADITQNAKVYREFLTRVEHDQPFFDSASRSTVSPAGGSLKKLVFENVYTTHSGLFGYSQHELINRIVMYYRKQGDYLYLQTGGKQAYLEQLSTLPVKPASPGLNRLLAQVPAGANRVDFCRLLNQTGDLLGLLEQLENAAHAELQEYLVSLEKVIRAHPQPDEKQFEEMAALEMPPLVLSANLDTVTRKPYLVLVGGLRYPRPKVLPLLRELLGGFMPQADNLGGGLVYTRTADGLAELALVQNTDALALLVKTGANAFVEKYVNAPGGRAKLLRAIAMPGDGDMKWQDEMLLVNILWESFLPLLQEEDDWEQ